MKIAFINGSPKAKGSASICILEELKAFIDKQHTFLDYSFRQPGLKLEQMIALSECDVLIFAFPLYVDGIPSHMLHCLIMLEEFFKTVQNKKITIYTFVNSGFYEARQNALAVEMMHHWCKRSGLKWGQGVAIGAGGMLPMVTNVPVGHGPKRNLGNAFKILSTNISNLLEGETIYVTTNFPRFAYKISAEFGWRQRVKANGLKRKDLFRRK
jgi:hypothetical protein